MKPELGISGRQHSIHAQGTSNGDTRQKPPLSQCQLYHFWALHLAFRPPACLQKQLFRDEASDSLLTMLLSGVEHARPGLGTLWDLPAGGPQGNGAGTVQPELRRDGAVTAPTRSGGETSWWVAPALALLLEHRGMKSVTHPDACLGFCPLPTRELGGSSRTGPRGGERCRPGVRQRRRNRREANPAKYLEGGLGFQKRLGLCSNQSWQMHQLLESPVC